VTKYLGHVQEERLSQRHEKKRDKTPSVSPKAPAPTEH